MSPPCASHVPMGPGAAMIDRFAFPEELGLSKIEAPLAALLVTRERVAASVAFAVLYGDRARQRQPQQASIRVHISHLRKKFRRLDLHIDTIWGWGWKMPAAERERLMALIKARSPRSETAHDVDA